MKLELKLCFSFLTRLFNRPTPHFIQFLIVLLYAGAHCFYLFIFYYFYFACSKLDGCRVILCFQLSNGIMQNTITLKRTLQCVEAGQAFILKRGYLWSCKKKPTQTVMSSLLLALRAI